jgi:hypothetical protein
MVVRYELLHLCEKGWAAGTYQDEMNVARGVRKQSSRTFAAKPLNGDTTAQTEILWARNYDASWTS